MSVQRVVAPLTSSSVAFLKFASHPANTRLQPCSHVFRQFSSIQATHMSAKRKMQTSTAYQPHSFESQPPPPRNTGVPDSSIAGGIPQVNDTRPPTMPQTSQSADHTDRSITEQEAQKTKPVTADTMTASPSSQPKARPRSKLRARKAAMNLTPRAVERLREMLDQPEPKLIKVGVKNRGCSGLAYHLDYVEKPGPFDETVEQDGVQVLIDSKALFSIIGSEMDWQEDKLNQRFVFKNPNIKEQCGCGESFMV